MPSRSPAAMMLEGETRALLTRLDRVRPFALHETMVPAAALAPAAHIAVERLLSDGRRELHGRLHDYLRWLRGPGGAAPPTEMQRRYAVLRWRFNDVLTHFDLFADAITQRSERDVGVWLSGLDVAAADGLTMPGVPIEPPPIVCYLDRGPGAAIRRARTRLPGGALSPVAIVRVPRERMVGYGIGGSLLHEVGHQAAALLGLVESLRGWLLEEEKRARDTHERLAWRFFGLWISEIVADFWSVAKLGIAATLGLVGVVSLPRPFVFRISSDDVHPFPYIRVHLSCAIGRTLYPHEQWLALARLWSSLYPVPRLDADAFRLIQALESSAPRLAALIAGHRPKALGGRSLAQLMPLADRSPVALRRRFEEWARRPRAALAAPPTLVFAVLGQARVAGWATPEQESRALGALIEHWALTSTLEAAEASATASRPALVTSTTN